MVGYLSTMQRMSELKVTLGSEVRRLRERANLSQEALAEKLGVTREAISRIERGLTRVPEEATLIGLETYVGLSRLRAYQLVTSQDGATQEAGALLQQIAALPSHQDRMEAWNDLPLSLRQAVMVFAQDLLHDAGLRVQESSERTSPHR